MTFRHLALSAAMTLSVVACGSETPDSESSDLDGSETSRSQGDEIRGRRPELRVTNARTCLGHGRANRMSVYHRKTVGDKTPTRLRYAIVRARGQRDLLEALQGPEVLRGDIEQTSTLSDGQRRFAALEKPIFGLPVELSKLAALLNDREGLHATQLVIFDDPNDLGFPEDAHAIVAKGKLVPAKAGAGILENTFAIKTMLIDNVSGRGSSDGGEPLADPNDPAGRPLYDEDDRGDDDGGRGKSKCERIPDEDFRQLCEDSCDRVSDPLVLDLGSDGIRLTSAKAGARFDINGAGATERVAWFQPGNEDDALLIMRPGFSAELTGKNLFSEVTRFPKGLLNHQVRRDFDDGFDALAELDKNHDHRLSENELQPIEIWIDRNGNGIAEMQETRRLADLHVGKATIRSVSLKTSNALATLGEGSSEASVYSEVELSNGKSIKLYDVWLQTRK